MFPGVILHLTYWYRADEMSIRLLYFCSYHHPCIDEAYGRHPRQFLVRDKRRTRLCVRHSIRPVRPLWLAMVRHPFQKPR